MQYYLLELNDNITRLIYAHNGYSSYNYPILQDDGLLVLKNDTLEIGKYLCCYSVWNEFDSLSVKTFKPKLLHQSPSEYIHINKTKKEIKDKSNDLKGNMLSQGTTPRRLTDLIGSLCDLTSGSGDKGTPVVFIQGYFNNYTN